jgi:hypothetical protein
MHGALPLPIEERAGVRVTQGTFPLTRLPSRRSAFEVRVACDEIVNRTARATERAERERAQLAQRREFERTRRNAPTRAEIEARLGRKIGP